MKKIGVYLNLEKERVLAVAKEIINWLEDNGVQVFLNEEGARAVARPELYSGDRALFSDVDCLVVLGGDGTLLSCARAVAPGRVPLLGVNLGMLGFLTETEIPGVTSTLEKLIKGEYQIEERLMLRASVIREHKVIQNFFGLNDVVITKGALARLIKLGIFVNEEYVSTYPADGLIVASPTGSTAYSLSAGGPLVSPDMDVMLITPVCPHTLYSRPLVISGDKDVKIILLSHQEEVMLTIDGQHGYLLKPGDQVTVNKAPFKARFIKFKDRSFYEVLRAKLREGGRADQ